MDGLDRTAVRQSLIIRGLVQGVGCRPWVWQQATRLKLSGWVRNTHAGVELVLDGPAADVEAMVQALWHMPSPARVEQVAPLLADALPPIQTGSFDILPSPVEPDESSLGAAMGTAIGTDLAVCETCLNELFDPSNRRWRHPFIHCPQCGPRYTVVRQLPFDRPHTSLAAFQPCPACQAEVLSPADRRFHDQTNACPHCGPSLSLFLTDGQAIPGDPIAQSLSLLQQGQIVAIKGIGGFHLCCDARQPHAVARLRERKHRPSKPLAVMAANVASLRDWAQVSPDEAPWLQKPERPIVLLPQTDRAQAELPGIAPSLAWLGAMLPYAPLHHLLFHQAAGCPSGTDWLNQPQDLLLVMTSGNASGQPLVIDNDAAWQDLAPLADALLLHDRDIVARNDDSVLRVRSDGSACWLRRGRGFAPRGLRLPPPAPGAPVSVLASGGDLKATLCLSAPSPHLGQQAWLTPHVGDLDSADTRAAFHALSQHWLDQRQARPQALACDLHPDFYSHRVAAELAQQYGVPLVTVQHHHAHIAAVLAEHADDPASLDPVIGLALDGYGMGADGHAWGGELLRVHQDQCVRLGHLHPLNLPGGEKAAREPWRMGAAALHAIGRGADIPERFADQASAGMLRAWLASGATTGTAEATGSKQIGTTSLGRLFDAAAGVLRLLSHADQEAHAAMLLESVACRAWPAPPLTDGCVLQPLPSQAPDPMAELDWRPLMRWLSQQPWQDAHEQAHAAAVFHATLAHGLAQWAIETSQTHGIQIVVLSGGCLANRLLDESLTSLIQSAGLTVWRASQYPCGDGALSLGQAWVAQRRTPPSHSST
ncbi:MAG: carbamoyltransferase HypF [Burkholderiales bacterium]|nr:carbamoyltransferase HypF [Burkholderiales bacterium]